MRLEAGSPSGMPLVRNPLLWLGAADPLDTQAELRASDPVREALVAMLTAWQDTFGDRPASVADAVEGRHSSGTSRKASTARCRLPVAGERNGDTQHAYRLGRCLRRRHVRRIENGFRCESAGTDSLSKRPLYRVVALTGVTGVTGVIPNPSREIARCEFICMG